MSDEDDGGSTSNWLVNSLPMGTPLNCIFGLGIVGLYYKSVEITCVAKDPPNGFAMQYIVLPVKQI
jgi:hypothetical protein